MVSSDGVRAPSSANGRPLASLLALHSRVTARTQSCINIYIYTLGHLSFSGLCVQWQVHRIRYKLVIELRINRQRGERLLCKNL